MNREKFNTCMSPYIRGKDKTKEERRMSFCVGAKVCSGHAKNEEEARQICLTQPPKESKPRKSSKCPDPASLAACVATNINIEDLSIDNLTARLEAAIIHCNGKDPLTYKRFMNTCLKELGGDGDFLSSQSYIRKCQTKWNEMRGI